MPRKNKRHIKHGHKLSMDLRRLMRSGPYGKPAGRIPTTGSVTAGNGIITRKKDTEMENQIKNTQVQAQAQALQAPQVQAQAQALQAPQVQAQAQVSQTSWISQFSQFSQPTVKSASSYQRILGQELRPMRPQGDRDPRIVRGSVWFANLGGRYNGETPTHILPRQAPRASISQPGQRQVQQTQAQPPIMETMQVARPASMQVARPVSPQVARPASPQVARPASAPLPTSVPTSVQSGVRPVLVISNDLSNLTSSTITIIPFTGAPKRMDMPTHVAVKAQDVRNGYCPSQIYESTLLCEQVTTIDKSKLVAYIGGVVSEKLMCEVEKAVLLQVGIAEKPAEALSAPLPVSSQLEQ